MVLIFYELPTLWKYAAQIVKGLEKYKNNFFNYALD